MLKSGLSLAALCATLALAPVAAAAPTPSHAYDLNGSLADALGGPSLALSGISTLGAAGVSFTNPNHSGLVLANPASVFGSDSVYSIEAYFSFANVSGYNRVLNWNGNDNGVYIHGGAVDYYDNANGYGHDAGTFSAGAMHHLVFTRNATAMDLYLDGTAVLSLPSWNSSLLAGDLRFFIDDQAEESSGYADFIRLYDTKLSAGDVATLYNGGSPLGTSGLISPVPEPATWASMLLGFALLGAAVRRRPQLAMA